MKVEWKGSIVISYHNKLCVEEVDGRAYLQSVQCGVHGNQHSSNRQSSL